MLTPTHMHSLDGVVQTKNVFVQNKNDLCTHLGCNLLESHPTNIRYQVFQRLMGVKDRAGPPGSYFIFSPACKNIYTTTWPPCVFLSFSIADTFSALMLLQLQHELKEMITQIIKRGGGALIMCS